MRVEVFENLESLPPRYLQLLEAAEACNVFQSLNWYRNLLTHTRDSGDRILLYGVETAAPTPAAQALLVGRKRNRGTSPLEPDRFEEFSNFYSLEAGPVLSPSVDAVDAVLDCLVNAISEQSERCDVIRFGPMTRDSEVFDNLTQSLKRHRFVVEPFFQHANWYEDVPSSSFEDFVRGRGKSLKKTIQKSRKLDREHAVEWSVINSSDKLDEALSSYERIYNESWKEPEIYPDFMPRLIADCAAAGSLRLGNLSVDGHPAATQLAFLSGRSGVLFKTAYSDKFGQYSCGNIAILRTVQHFLSVDRVDRIDLGPGDELYKSTWVSKRRERWGLLAYNLTTVKGCLGALSSSLRGTAKSIMHRLPSKT